MFFIIEKIMQYNYIFSSTIYWFFVKILVLSVSPFIVSHVFFQNCQTYYLVSGSFIFQETSSYWHSFSLCTDCSLGPLHSYHSETPVHCILGQSHSFFDHLSLILSLFFSKSSTEDTVIGFRERERKREREREKHQCKRETLIGCLLHTP